MTQPHYHILIVHDAITDTEHPTAVITISSMIKENLETVETAFPVFIHHQTISVAHG